MIAFFKQTASRWIILLKNRRFILKAVLSLVFLVLSIIASYFARAYVDGFKDGHIVPDILLDHLPTLDVSYLFFQGAFIFAVMLTVILLLFPDFLPFTLISSALLFFTRSLFMIMTHLSAPNMYQYSYIDYEQDVGQVLFTINSGNDLFFSGHVAFPFLLALIFWRKKPLRYLFLLCSIIASAVVLVGHLHYSIDVFSAFFITYGVFEISKRLFKKDFMLD